MFRVQGLPYRLLQFFVFVKQWEWIAFPLQKRHWNDAIKVPLLLSNKFSLTLKITKEEIPFFFVLFSFHFPYFYHFISIQTWLSHVLEFHHICHLLNHRLHSFKHKIVPRFSNGPNDGTEKRSPHSLLVGSRTNTCLAIHPIFYCQVCAEDHPSPRHADQSKRFCPRAIKKGMIYRLRFHIAQRTFQIHQLSHPKSMKHFLDKHSTFP